MNSQAETEPPTRKSLRRIRRSQHERRALEEVRRKSRRRFLKLGGAALLVAGATAVGISKIPRTEQSSLQLTIEGLEPRTAELVRRVAKRWDDRYGCNRPIKIVPYAGEAQRFGRGTITTVDEVDPGLIKLGNTTSVESAILHAMNHACHPDNPTLFEKPLSFVDGVIRGFHGLNLLVTTKLGEDTKFTLFEEGMAERNASDFPEYRVSEPRYYAIGNLTRTRVPFDNYPDAHQWSKNNDVISFLRAALNLPQSGQITVRHIQQAMSLYQDSWNQAEKTL